MESKNSRKRVHCELACRGVWLVKVPRYLSDLWEANAGQDVGRMVIENGRTGSQVKLISKPGLGGALSDQSHPAAKAPEEHSLFLHDPRGQSMQIMIEDKTKLKENADVESGELVLQGRVAKRADCRPADERYMKMKVAQIQKSQQPHKFVQHLDRAAVKFKPVSVHEEDVARIRQKKEGAKLVRADEDVVTQAIFHAFEKHQYYRLHDLQQLLQQPAGFIKEILQRIATYNMAPPHKSMWELKPEYRNYVIKK